MLRHIKLESSKTYATEANAIKAVEKVVSPEVDVRHFVHKIDDGRFFPVFVGQRALDAGLHFRFNCVT
jgi:hypothetical protein